MRPAAAATAATAAAATVTRGSIAAAAPGGGKHRKCLGQFLRAAVRARRSFPVAGTDEDFAVLPALLTMKLVNRHGARIIKPRQNSSAVRAFLTTDAHGFTQRGKAATRTSNAEH